MSDAYRALFTSLVALSSFLVGCGGIPEDGATTRVAGSIQGGDHGDFQITSPDAQQYDRAPRHRGRNPVGAPRPARSSARAEPAPVRRAYR